MTSGGTITRKKEMYKVSKVFVKTSKNLLGTVRHGILEKVFLAEKLSIF